MDAAEVSGLDRDAFVARFGGLYEASPWVASQAWTSRPWATAQELATALQAVVAAAPREARLALLRAHPDLSAAAARPALTAESAAEQAAAGLDAIDPERAERLARLNRDYRARFGFPFIVCAREHDPGSILALAESRLGNDAQTEEATALGEVAKIARLRLEDVVA